MDEVSVNSLQDLHRELADRELAGRELGA
jgi:hypothetical protein